MEGKGVGAAARVDRFPRSPSRMAPPLTLPSPSELPRQLLAFLDGRLNTHRDLRGVPSLAAELGAECDGLERHITCKEEEISSLAEAWAARSTEARTILRRLKSDLGALMLRPSPGGNEEIGSSRMRRIVERELPLLAKELGRIEIVRRYAETSLHLEALMGDLEDAALCLISQNSRNVFVLDDSDASRSTGATGKQKKLLVAIKTMGDIDKVLITIVKDQLPWTHLIMAVDSRVQKTMAVLRPQTLTDHRSILASIGWPPPLSTSILGNGSCFEVPNPLILMKEDKKELYSQSFLALLALQVLQAKQERRKHDVLMHQQGQTPLGSTELGNGLNLESNIWTVNELVSPIASRVEHHFSKWSDQPEYIFALTYRITRDLLDGVDNVLQPLIDKAMVAGFSATDAWISAMVKMLIACLKKQIFPDLSRRYDDENMGPEVISSWLNLMDHIITFDKKMRALAGSGIFLTSSFAEFNGTSTSQPLSILSLFCDHSEWIELWAQIELKYALDKLEAELEKDEAWTVNIKQETEFIDNQNADSFTFSSIEHCKAPPISVSVMIIAWAMIERGWTLPSMSLKIKFVRSSANNFLHQFSSMLHQYCQEFETFSVMEDDAIRREANTINAALYCESVMLEWSENVNFLEMSVAENGSEVNKENLPFSCFFADEIRIFSKLETDCLVEITSALLLEFDYCCYDYIQRGDRWGEEPETDKVDEIPDEQIMGVSTEFVEALHMLKDRLQILKLYLNIKDFLDMWRSIAGGLDHFIFKSILLSNVRFSDGGIQQFRTDMLALFLVFKPFCIRPEAFFPCISDSLKLFGMCQRDVKHLMVALSREKRDQGCLHSCGLFHIIPAQVEKILSNRK